MQKLDEIKNYVNSVCEQVRWKKARTILGDEIENHIIDQKNAFMLEGFDEKSAINKAIYEMGDPVIVGTQLDRTHRPKTEWSMIILTIFTLLIGLIINFFVENSTNNLPQLHYFYKSVLSVVIGIVCMSIAYFIDFTIIGKYPKIIFALLTGTIIIFFQFGISINGVNRWIVIPMLGTFTVSIFVLLFPTAYAGIIYNMRNKGYLGIIICGVFYVIPAFIFFRLNYEITNIFIYTLTCFILLAISIFAGWFNVKRLYGILVVFVPTVLISIVFLITIFNSPYRAARFNAFLNPLIDPYGIGYRTILTRDILSGAKFFGQGKMPVDYGGDISSLLPSINIDYILTYLIHRIGWVAFIAILAVLMTFIVRGFYLCTKQKSVLGRLVATSVVLTFTLQTFIYISANLGFQMLSQPSLPLISYGGTSIIINLILIGIMLSVFKSGYLLRDSAKNIIGNKNKIFEFIDGKIIIDLGLKSRQTHLKNNDQIV